MPFVATWMDLEIIILSEVKHRKINIMISLICGFLKNDTNDINELIYKTEAHTQHTKLWVTKGER